MVLHYSHCFFLCQAQNEFICFAPSAFPIVLTATPSPTVGQEPSPLQSQSFPCDRGLNTLIFPSALGMGEEPHPPQAELTIRCLLSIIPIASFPRRLGAITQTCQTRNPKVLVEE